jgi:hypothetical protein
MSLADYASRPFPVLAKFLGFLRNIFAVNVAFVGSLAHFRAAREKVVAESPPHQFEAGAPAVISHSSDLAAVAESNPRAERETLIRRRWSETGIRMWNPKFHGEGRAALNIQGGVELLAPAPGETVRRYDRLEFRLISRRIVCEGIAVDCAIAARSSPSDC